MRSVTNLSQPQGREIVRAIVDRMLESDPDEIDPRQSFKDLYTWQNQLDYFGYTGERNGGYYMRRYYDVPNSNPEGFKVCATATTERRRHDSPEEISVTLRIQYQNSTNDYVGDRLISMPELPNKMRELEMAIGRYGDYPRLYDQLVSWLQDK